LFFVSHGTALSFHLLFGLIGILLSLKSQIIAFISFMIILSEGDLSPIYTILDYHQHPRILTRFDKNLHSISIEFNNVPFHYSCYVYWFKIFSL